MDERLLDGVLFKDTVKKCVKELEDNKEADSVEMFAGNLVMKDDEYVEVRITVNRKEEDFLDPFTMIVNVNKF